MFDLEIDPKGADGQEVFGATPTRVNFPVNAAASQWTTANPVLAAGAPSLVSDTHKTKLVVGVKVTGVGKSLGLATHPGGGKVPK